MASNLIATLHRLINGDAKPASWTNHSVRHASVLTKTLKKNLTTSPACIFQRDKAFLLTAAGNPHLHIRKPGDAHQFAALGSWGCISGLQTNLSQILDPTNRHKGSKLSIWLQGPHPLYADTGTNQDDQDIQTFRLLLVRE